MTMGEVYKSEPMLYVFGTNDSFRKMGRMNDYSFRKMGNF